MGQRRLWDGLRGTAIPPLCGRAAGEKGGAGIFVASQPALPEVAFPALL